MNEWYDSSVNSNILRKTYVNGFLDVSQNISARNNLYVNGDVSFNSGLYVGGSLTIPDKTINITALKNNNNLSNTTYKIFVITAYNSAYYIDEVSRPTILLYRGLKYSLDVNDNSTDSHPFYIQTTDADGLYDSDNVYNDGVTGNGYTTGVIDFLVPDNAPDTLYYRCSNHSGMGGIIRIENYLNISDNLILSKNLDVNRDILVNSLTIGRGNGDISTNSAVGYQSLKSNTTGEYNTAIGYQSLYSNIDGSYNVAIGDQALRQNTNGNNNTAVGYQSLLRNTTANYNTGIGYRAGWDVSNSAAKKNTFIGNNTGFDVSINGYTESTALGTGALITASNQIMLGRSTEKVVVPGKVGIGNITDPKSKLSVEGNLYVGINSDTYAAPNNGMYVKGNVGIGAWPDPDKLAVGGSVKITGDVSMNSKLIVGGDVSMNSNLNVGGNVGIGTTTPSAALDVNGNISTNGNILINTEEQFAGGHFIKMHTGWGNDGGLFLYRGQSDTTTDNLNFKFILENDGIGNIIKNNNIAISFPNNGDVSMNNKLRVGSDTSFNGDVTINGNLEVIQQTNQNTVINTTVNDYQLIVTQDLSLNGNLELSGKINGATIISDVSLLNLIIGNGTIDDPAPDGSNNVGFGNNVLKSITTGDKNIAMGNHALTNVTTGDNNIAIGTWSQIGNKTGNYNVSIGTQSLDDNITGHSNTAIGFQALQKYTKSRTTAIGYNAGGDITAGELGNTFIGFGTGFDDNSATYTESTALGYQAKITKSNQIVLGGIHDNGYPEVFIPGDASFNGNLNVGGTLNIGLRADGTSNGTIRTGRVELHSAGWAITTRPNQLALESAGSAGIGFYNSTFGSSDLSTTPSMVIQKGGDVSMNNKLRVGSDTSFNGNLDVTDGLLAVNNGMVKIGTGTYTDIHSSGYTSNPKLAVNSHIYTKGLINYSQTGSLPSAIDLNTNEIVFVTTGRDRMIISPDGDTSFNGDVTINGNLEVIQQTYNNRVINTTVNDYQLIVTEDLSLNGDLSVSGDAFTRDITVYKPFNDSDALDAAGEIKFKTSGNNGNVWEVGSIQSYVKAYNGTSWGYPGGLAFKTKNASNTDHTPEATTKMVIDASGYVGIGTTTPSATLDVSGDIIVGNGSGSNVAGGKIVFDKTSNTAGPNKIILYGNSGYGIGVDNSTVKYISGGNNHKFYYGSTNSTSNGTLGMTLDQKDLTIEGGLHVKENAHFNGDASFNSKVDIDGDLQAKKLTLIGDRHYSERFDYSSDDPQQIDLTYAINNIHNLFIDVKVLSGDYNSAGAGSIHNFYFLHIYQNSTEAQLLESHKHAVPIGNSKNDLNYSYNNDLYHKIQVSFVGDANITNRRIRILVDPVNGTASIPSQGSIYVNVYTNTPLITSSTHTTNSSATVTENQLSSNQSVGSQGNTLLTRKTFSANVGIGTSSPSAALDVSGDILVNSLTVGKGTGIGNIAVGYQALYDNIDGSYNVAIGNTSLYSNTTGYSNTAVGHESLYSNTTGYSNTAVGYETLYSNTTGLLNTAIGNRVLVSNTTGAGNTATGHASLLFNTTGGQNCGYGYSALHNNTVGTNNVAVGYQALNKNTSGTHNVATGNSALSNNTTGVNNVATGASALISNTTGVNNVAVGYQSLLRNTTANYNTGIGYRAGWDVSNSAAAKNTFIGNNTGFDVSINGYTESTALGTGALITASNQIMLGRDSETVVVPGTLNVSKAATLSSTLNVVKAATLSSTLDVTGASTMGSTLKVNNTLTVSKATTLSSTLDVTGKSTFKNDISLNGNLFIDGDLSLNGNLAVIKQSNETIINTTVNDYTVIVTEDLSLNGNLSVSGDASFNGDLQSSGNFRSLPIGFFGNQNEAYLIAGASNSWTGANTGWHTYGFQHRIKTDANGNSRITIDTHSGEKWSLSQTGGFSMNGPVNVNSTLNVTGASTMGSTLKVNNTLTVSKASTLSSTLNVVGDASFNGRLSVTDDVSFNSGLYIGNDVIMHKQYTNSGMYPTTEIKFNTDNYHTATSENVKLNWDVASIQGYINANNGTRDNYPGGLAFNTKTPSSTLSTKMVIDANGNVGIGNTTPQNRLHLGKNIVNDYNFSYEEDALLVAHGTTPSSATTLKDPKDVLYLVREGTNNECYANGATFKLCRYENTDSGGKTRLDIDLRDGNFADNHVMTMLANGNVGIGTTTPQYALDVNGQTNLALMPGLDQIGTLLIGRSDGVGRKHSLSFKNSATSSNNYMAVNLHQGGTGDDVDASPVEVFRIRGDGNVGIGTITPSAALDVNGNISTNGNILINTEEQFAGGHFIKMHTGFGNDGGLFLYRGPSDTTTDNQNFKFILENNGIGNIIKDNNIAISFPSNGDVSMNNKLRVGSDTSFNGDVTINGNLEVIQQTNQNTVINTTVNDYQLIVTQDLSLNGDLELSGKINGFTLLSNDNSFNLIMGTGTINEPTGENNTGFGHAVLGNPNNSGSRNVAMGSLALTGISTGYDNVAIGTWSQTKNQTGYSNVSVGKASLDNNINGNSNTAIGVNALQNYQQNRTTAIGFNAGGAITDGGFANTFIGSNTGFDDNSATYNNSTALGYQAKITASNQIMLGRDTETVVVPGTLDVSGDVGIGTTTPNAKLHIYEPTGTTPNKSAQGSLVLEHGDNGGTSSITFVSAENKNSDYGYIKYVDTFGDIGTERSILEIGVQNDGGNGGTRDNIILKPSNNVGIGHNDDPISKLTVRGNLYVGSKGWEIAAPENGMYVEGNVGIGTSNPSHKLHVVGTTLITGDTSFNSKVDIDGDLQAKKLTLIGDRHYSKQFDFSTNDGTTTTYVNNDGDTMYSFTPTDIQQIDLSMNGSQIDHVYFDIKVVSAAGNGSAAVSTHNHYFLNFYNSDRYAHLIEGSEIASYTINDTNKHKISIQYIHASNANDKKIRILVDLPQAYNADTSDNTVTRQYNTGSIYLNVYTDTPVITGSTHITNTTATFPEDTSSDIDYDTHKYFGSDVGIGTTNPLAALDVSGDILVNSLTVGKGTGTGNTAVGYQALYDNTDGSYNVAIGNTSLRKNTTGYNNTAVGHESLYSNTTGYANTAVGYETLYSNTTGLLNTAIGNRVLLLNTTGAGNTATGHASLLFNTTGGQNCGYGYATLQNNTIGSHNIAVGFHALSMNTSGTNNVATGNSALSNNTTGTHNVATGNSALIFNTTGVNNVAVGYQSLLRNTTANYNTGIGYRAGWDVSNSAAAKNTFIGYNTRFDVSINGYTDSTALGTGALITASNQIMLGRSTETVVVPGDASLNGNLELSGKINGMTLLFNDNSNNLIMGNDTIVEGQGQNNVGFGNDVLKSITTGGKNIAMGVDALSKVTSGGSNIAIGAWSQLNTTTSDNNVSIGTQALSTITGNSDNTAIGFQALQKYANGRTTAIGFNAGGNITVGGYANTFIGSNTGFDDNSATYKNSTALGYQAKITADYQIMLGRDTETVVVPGTLDVEGNASFNSNVTIDNDSNNPQLLVKPSSTVGQDASIEIRGARNFVTNVRPSSIKFTNYDDDISNNSVGGIHTFGQIWGQVDNSANNTGSLNFGTSSNGTSNANARMTITNSGNVGIGTTTPSTALDVNGSVTIGNSDGTNVAGGKIIFDGAYNTGGPNKIRLLGATGYGIGVDNSTVKYLTQGSNHKFYYDSGGAGNGNLGMTLSSKDLTIEGGLHVKENAYFNGDASFNGDTSFNGDVTINGNLEVIQQTNQNTVINTTVNDYQLIVTEDLSLNGNLSVSGAFTSDITVYKPYNDNDALDAAGEIKFKTSVSNGNVWEVGSIQSYIKAHDHNTSNLGYPGGLAFKTKNHSSTNDHTPEATTKMVIDASGYVGIGNTTPQNRLHLGKNIVHDNNFSYEEDALLVAHGTTPSSATTLNDPKDVLYLVREGTNTQCHANGATFKLCRYENTDTGGKTRLDIDLRDGNFADNHVMTMLANGNVGIGTTTPSAALDVSGDAIIGGARSQSASLNIATDNGKKAYLRLSEANGVTDDINAFGGYLKYDGDNANNNFHIGTMNNGNDYDRITINRGDGNVGIGTITPSATLDVNGTIQHKGLTMTSGTGIDQIIEFTNKPSFTANAWFDLHDGTNYSGPYIKYDGSTATSNVAYPSTYIVQLYIQSSENFDLHASGNITFGNHPTAYSDGNTEEIVLHRGYYKKANVWARMNYVTTGSNHEVRMQIKVDTSVSISNLDGYKLTLRRFM